MTIEVFSAGCSTCRETVTIVMELAGEKHEVRVLDLHVEATAVRAKTLGIRSLPAVVIDGKLAGCCAGRGPDEDVLRSELREQA